MKKNNYFKLAGVLGLIACGSVWADEPSDCDAISGTLAVGASCTVAGNFTPKQEGEQTVSVTLSYAEGEDFPLVTKTKSYTAIVEGKVAQELPKISTVGTAYPVKFTFTNKTEIPVANVKVEVTPLDAIEKVVVK